MSQAQELLIKLKALLHIIEEYDLASQERVEAQQALSSPSLEPSHLKDFDAAHMEQFIKEKIGTRPTEPNGIIKILVPVYLSKKSQYAAAHATYEKIRPLAEAAYRETYQTQREELRIQDEVEKTSLIKTARSRLEAAKVRVVNVEEKLRADDTVSVSLKKKDTIERLISYLEEGRADNLKEAVNLFYDEKRKDAEAQKADAHRKEMKALEEEKVRAAQAAEEYQRLQYEEAQQATRYAQQTAMAAQDAAEAAEKAQYN